MAGVLHTYFLGGGTVPVYALQFHPQDVIREADVLKAVKAVKAAAPIPGARFAFVAAGEQQMVATVGAALAASGIEVIPLDRILGSIV